MLSVLLKAGITMTFSKALLLLLLAINMLGIGYDFLRETFQDRRIASVDTGYDPNANVTALQQHVLFWDTNKDGLVSTKEVYTGFRALGFSIPFSIGGLLINIFFSYPTQLAHSFFPDPFHRIHIDSIHNAKHGSDTGVYDSDGRLRLRLFDEMFEKLDGSGTGSLGVADLFSLIKKNRVAADPAGWSFAFMEWWTTWLLLQRHGRVWKDDLRQCYDGNLFWRVREDRASGRMDSQGYGWSKFFTGLSSYGTWKTWEHDEL